MNLPLVHLYLAYAVAVLAVFGVWRRPERRITVYVVTLQIALGVVLMARGAVVPWYHPVLAVLGWIGYMAANSIARREPASRTALIVSAASSLLVLAAFAVGMQVRAGG